jgi:hypothetical protein
LVLALEDGSAASWLSDTDVEYTVQGVASSGLPSIALRSAGDAESDARTGSASAVAQSEGSLVKVLSHRVGPAGDVVVVYELLHLDVQEVVVQLKVCGVKLGPDGGWRAYRLQSSLSCLAVGTHLRTLPVVVGARNGLAVSADEKWMVVGLYDACTLSVYSLPDGELVRTFGGPGSGPLQFSDLYRLCFAPNGNLLIVDSNNVRLQ